MARPNPEIGVCDRIYIEPIISEGIAKRASKNQPRGSRQIEYASMNTGRFNEVTMKTLEKAASEFPLTKNIAYIVDGAGGHGVGQRGQRALERALSPTYDWIRLN